MRNSKNDHEQDSGFFLRFNKTPFSNLQIVIRKDFDLVAVHFFNFEEVVLHCR